MQANMGMAGEFRCVVKRADGSTKVDTGYQKNLILNQGLDFFGGGNGSNMMEYCVIGGGNSQPVYTQNKLDTALAGTNGSDISTKYDYDAARDGSLYKTNRVRKYSFTGLNNVNVSELGLASTYSNATTYFLCTRALIKDSLGNPTTITVLQGEILDIYYKLWAVYDTTDKTGTFNLLDGTGGSVAYNYKSKLAFVGKAFCYDSGYADYIVGAALKFMINNTSGHSINTFYTGELGSITGTATNYLGDTPNGIQSLSNYANGSYKRQMIISIPASSINGNIRAMDMNTSMGSYQIRFGSVANDSPITKTNTQKLSIPIEFSWGRYEGAL